MDNKRNDLEILDCTIRDGGYVNNWDFDSKLVRETYRALSKAGVDYVELGYHGSEKYFDLNKFGPFRFSTAKNISKICSGIDGAKVSLMVDHGKFDLDDLLQYKDSPVKMIRSAFHKTQFEEALQLLMKVKELGFIVSANFMGFASYNKEEMGKLIAILKELSIDYAYVADTYGSMFPDVVPDFFAPLLSFKHIQWGFHPHNNLQMSFANSLAAIKAGAKVVDCSVFGMGRGAGNLPTECMLAYLHRLNPEKYNVIPVLNLIDRYYNKLKSEYPWGYNLPYMLSGVYGCHPNYSKDLVERKEYDIEDIWNILEAITINSPVGYKRELVDRILKKGIFGNKETYISVKENTSTKKANFPVRYLNSHKDKDFLVLANGPTLKQFQTDIQSFINKYNPIVMGGNYLGDLFVPHYHAFSNKRRFVDYIDKVSPKSRLLLSQYLSNNLINEYIDRKYELMYYYDSFTQPFGINNGIITSNCRTIAVLLVGIALVMGAKRVFMVGMDGYMATSSKDLYHFYNEDNETNRPDSLKEKHNGNLNYLKQIDNYMVKNGLEGLHILTPTNYKEFYKGIKNYI